MVSITDRARAHVHKLIETNKLGDVHLRFSVTGGGCSGFNYNLVFAREPEAGDQVLELGDQTITIFRDPDSLERELLAKAPEDASAIREFTRLIRNHAHTVTTLLLPSPM